MCPHGRHRMLQPPSREVSRRCVNAQPNSTRVVHLQLGIWLAISGGWWEIVYYQDYHHHHHHHLFFIISHQTTSSISIIYHHHDVKKILSFKAMGFYTILQVFLAVWLQYTQVCFQWSGHVMVRCLHPRGCWCEVPLRVSRSLPRGPSFG